MLRSATLVLSGNAAASLVLLARNLIIARLIPVEDFGIAATFAMVMAIVEMASTFGLQQRIIQAKEGDDPAFQAGLQGFQLLRGAIASLILLAISGPVARFLGVSGIAWAYQLLALVPVLTALQHLDVHRLNRHRRFAPEVLSVTVPAAVSLLLLWPLSILFADWRIMLWALLAQAALATLTSHIVAERRYRVRFDPQALAASLRFGWPLLLNGALLFLVFQGDKLIVAREMGLAALAIFSMGVTLTLTPTLVIAKSAQTVFLPGLSRATDAFAEISAVMLQAILAASLLFSLAIFLFGGLAVEGLLGDKYRALIPVLVWFALVQSLRLLKAGPAIAALALGQTRYSLAANILRAASLPLAWYAAVKTGEIQVLLWIAAAGELAGCGVAFALLGRHRPILTRAIVLPYGLGLGVLAVFGGTAAGLWPYPQATIGPALAASIGIALCFASMQDLRRALQRSRQSGKAA